MPRPRKRQRRAGYQEGKHASPGQGAVGQLKDGSWRGAFTWHNPDTGERRRIWVRGRDEADVRERWETKREELEGVDPAPVEGLTVRDFLTDWLDTVIRVQRRVLTYESYSRICVSACKHIGSVLLTELRPEHIQRCFAQQQAAGTWGASTVRNAHARLVTAFNYAIELGYLTTNPALKVRLPRVDRVERRLLTPDQVRSVLAYAERIEDPLLSLWALYATTGLRRGEGLGLRWQDVDLDGGLLYVTGQLVLSESEGAQRMGPKTASSRRPLVLMPQVIALLRQHRTSQDQVRAASRAPWPPDGWVFCRADGRPFNPQAVYGRWRRLLKSAGLPAVRLHDLRHGLATELARREPIKVVQEVLGHADIRTTLNTYSHVMPGMQRDAISRLSGVIWPETAADVAPVVASEGETHAC